MEEAVRAIMVARHIVVLAQAFIMQWGLTHVDGAGDPVVPLDRDVEAASIEAMELIRQGRDGRDVLTALRAAAINGQVFVDSHYRELVKLQNKPGTVMEWAALMDGDAPSARRPVTPERVARSRRGEGGTLASAMELLSERDETDGSPGHRER
ncbi:hypothetical protein [Georgenia yuyongxinii]|uniref:Uncharacterized protein n=1 Tax=Georgenia yuyongxinii TaxID=2589797 RepID=A0A552WUE4_9MICO|nr:hypothetical protein [Georgenia yuyongxinii]TRW46394.1 hypothetical protein FJ693_05560 [Georgenia yuyongxinii]